VEPEHKGMGRTAQGANGTAAHWQFGIVSAGELNWL